MNRNYTGQKKIMGAGLGGRAWSEQWGYTSFYLFPAKEQSVKPSMFPFRKYVGLALFQLLLCISSWERRPE